MNMDISPQDLEVDKLFQSGAAKLENRQYEESVVDFTKELSINPNHIPSNMQITYSLRALERNIEALPYADKVIEVLPDWDTYEIRSSIKRSLGDFEGAEQDYKIAVGIPKDGCM